ncbi:unnamed protein product [Ceutorhynchus assimilis]|uniref:Uncharacterized protein n=1 Tax=Ceutorhynchus assimilis TaxID=467358 RepID=A0A9N9MD84_9CUCU|nr:unnamed protein product [Ceutorhynchus assimilis]
MILNNVLTLFFLPILVSAYSDFKKSYLVDHCDKIYSLACFKLEAANWIDKFGVSSELNIIPGVSILQNSNSVRVDTNAIAKEVTREFPSDQNARVNQFFIKKIENFLNGHSLKLNLWKAFNGEELSASDDIETARGDKTKKSSSGGSGGMSMILISGAMIVGVMTALTMGGLTALAGKALLTGLVALVLSAIIGLKELVGQSKTLIAQPVSVPAHEVWEEYPGHHSRMTQELPKGLQPEYTPA